MTDTETNKTKQTSHQQSNTSTILKPKPSGVRARAVNPPPPLVDQACQTRTRELTDSKASVASAHSARPVTSSGSRALRASNFRFLSDFRSSFSFAKNHLNFGSPNAPKSQKYDLAMFLAPISLLVPIQAPIFSIFHDTPDIVILQQVSSKMLTFTCQTLSFWDKISIGILCFFGSRFWTLYFSLFFNIVCRLSLCHRGDWSSD